MVVTSSDRQLVDGVKGMGSSDDGGGILHIVELSKCADCMT